VYSIETDGERRPWHIAGQMISETIVYSHVELVKNLGHVTCYVPVTSLGAILNIEVGTRLNADGSRKFLVSVLMHFSSSRQDIYIKTSVFLSVASN